MGSGITAANALDAQVDYESLKTSGRNGILKIQAIGARNDQMLVVGALLCDLGASLLMIRRTDKDCDSPLDRYGPFFAAIGSVFLTVVSTNQRRRRKKMLDALRLRRSVRAKPPAR